MATAAVAPVLELSGIHKAFPGVKALSEAGLRLYPGEVHTLMGQNGAGKSTLIKVLTGVHAPDQGSIVMEGREIRPSSTLEAQELGISTVYQEVNLCPNLSVAENIFIGRYPRKWGMVDWAGMRTRAASLAARAGDRYRRQRAAVALSAGDPADGGDLPGLEYFFPRAGAGRADVEPG